MPITVSDRFDSGAIEFLSASPDGQVELALRADSHADFRQWFHFRLQGARGLPLHARFVNAGACTYVEGWRDYRVVASYDRRHWFRVDTTFDGQRMVAAHVPEKDSVYYAYFEPYPEERHLELLGRVDGTPRARVSRLGGSVEGRDVDLVTVGEASERTRSGLGDRAPAPGETMAEWFVEGLLDRLTDRRRPGGAFAARARGVPRRAEHEPGRQRARQPAHQRRWREPQPRVAGARPGAEPRGALRARRDARNRRRRVPRRPWRRSAALRVRRRRRAAAVLHGGGRRTRSLLQGRVRRREPRFPDTARLSVEQGHQGQPGARVQVRRSRVRRR